MTKQVYKILKMYVYIEYCFKKLIKIIVSNIAPCGN